MFPSMTRRGAGRFAAVAAVGAVAAAFAAVACPQAEPAWGDVVPLGIVGFVGVGTVSPGWSPAPRPQTFTMGGQGVVVVEPSTEAGAVSCTFTGTDTIGTVTEGAGDVNGSCDAQPCTEEIAGSYERVGGAVTITGTMTVGCGEEDFEASCEIEPTGFDPAEGPAETAFEISCEFKTGPKGVAGLVGNGTISPGLSLVSRQQTVALSATGDVIPAPGQLGVNGPLSCNVTGDDTIGTVVDGSGSFSGSCTTPCGTIGVSGKYSRTLAILSVSGSFASPCFLINAMTFDGKCVIVPTGLGDGSVFSFAPPPVTAFDIGCGFTLS